MQVQLLVRAYQVRGHHIANLDPLRILDADLDAHVPPELTLDYYGWTEADLSKEFSLSSAILPRFVGHVADDKMTLGEIINELKTMYCESSSPVNSNFEHELMFRPPHWCSICSHHRPRTM